MSRVVLAMSGGVDSSVAAALLIEAGHEVIGVFMRHGITAEVACSVPTPEGRGQGAGSRIEGRGTRESPTASPRAPRPSIHAPFPSSPTLPVVNTARADHKQGCCSASDAQDARRVADRLDIPFYALNLEEEFGRIIDYFVDEYTHARTPNPCVVCNHWIKFGKLFEYADSVGAEFVATGHYARIERAEEHDDIDGAPRLLQGIDAGKDQSYVLFGIDRRLLGRMLLPVGGWRKEAIRRRAAELGLRVADKPDSQEICFVTSGRHDEFVRARRGNVDTSGEIVTTDGRVVGTHPGIERFTIGQRKGLGVALGDRRFVVRIEPDTRRVVIGDREQLARGELTAGRTNWLTDPPAGRFRCQAKIRYNTPAATATAEVLPDERLAVLFDAPTYGVAPGQAVVLYDQQRMLGGGWIE